jgi:uncharacterized protein with GYD domain
VPAYFLTEFDFSVGSFKSYLHLPYRCKYMKGGSTMAKYISLVKYTAEGVENVKESPDRLDAFKQLCESMGAKVEGFYLTMGRYDLVVIVDAPTPEAVSNFSEEEYRKIISELP